jgi:broad specificity phosphatase PhoE
VVASTLRRSWEAAQIVSGGAPIRLENDFREIHFGRWEGLTKSEIEASDPIAYRDWQAKKAGFEFPGGELRAQLRARVARGFARLEASGADAVLAVVHRGVIRALGEQLLGSPLADATPSLGEVVALSRTPGGAWYRGRHGSNPEGLEPVSVSA